MSGVTETTEPAESELTCAPTTPEEWRVFLERYGELYVNVRADEDKLFKILEDDDLEALARGEEIHPWLGLAPAGGEALAMAEERLGVRFPAGLRAFFLVSDGWTHINGWVDGVHACDRAVWMRDSEAGGRVIEIFASVPGNEEAVELLRRSIEIARGEDFWLLDPTDVGPDAEWAAYTFTPKYGDITKFAGFSALFHYGYAKMEEME
ncbi:SMI1/KNR4 family protein [Streptomyces sp. NPDC049916]|uniref:SMI1/KNR4 family protein n=1 Tax=Streptomyces sp. NPDC049916 TaxID=3155156 RepID=UPI00342B63D9